MPLVRMKKENKKKNGKKPPIDRLVNQMPSPADPLGSYTGRPADPKDKPAQDADDL